MKRATPLSSGVVANKDDAIGDFFWLESVLLIFFSDLALGL